MLGKLLKQELKVTSRYFIPMYVSFIVVTLLLKLSFFFSGGNEALFVNGTSALADFFQGLMIFLYVIVLVGINILTYFFIIKRFYSNLFGDEGYLMFTLPVSAGQLIGSKLISALIWLMIMVPMNLLSFVLLFVGTDAYRSFTYYASYFTEELHILSISGYHIGLLVFEIIVIAILSLLCSLLMFYFSIALAQHFFNEHRLLGTIGCYFVLSMIQSMIESFGGIFTNDIFTNILMSSNPVQLFSGIQMALPFTMIIYILLIVAYYIGTHFLIQKKLNLY